jgi:hypothetical protein
MNANIVSQRDMWREISQLAYDFLESLPHGWLAHTSGDVGLLNDFYIAYRAASHLSNSDSTTAEKQPNTD